MSPVERASKAIIADLHRQSANSGCATEDNGRLAQVDGSFEIEPLARAVLQAIREPSDAMAEAGLDLGPDRGPETYFSAMIDAALGEG